MNKYFRDQLDQCAAALCSIKQFAIEKLAVLKSSRNKEINLYVTPLEAKLGTKKTLTLTREHDRTERIVVTVPPGVRSGKRLRLKGKGVPGLLWISPGDILLNVQIINNK